MIELRQFDHLTEDFAKLDKMLDQDYYERFGDIALEYRQYNTLEKVTGFVLAYDGAEPVGCGCIRRLGPDAGELKRIFVCKEHRRKGIAGKIVRECEKMALEQGFSKMALQTGATMSQAIALYEKNGYHRIENYGDFAGDDLSVCMEKSLI